MNLDEKLQDKISQFKDAQQSLSDLLNAESIGDKIVGKSIEPWKLIFQNTGLLWRHLLQVQRISSGSRVTVTEKEMDRELAIEEEKPCEAFNKI